MKEFSHRDKCVLNKIILVNIERKENIYIAFKFVFWPDIFDTYHLRWLLLKELEWVIFYGYYYVKSHQATLLATVKHFLGNYVERFFGKAHTSGGINIYIYMSHVYSDLLENLICISSRSCGGQLSISIEHHNSPHNNVAHDIVPFYSAWKPQSRSAKRFDTLFAGPWTLKHMPAALCELVRTHNTGIDTWKWHAREFPLNIRFSSAVQFCRSLQTVVFIIARFCHSIRASLMRGTH